MLTVGPAQSTLQAPGPWAMTILLLTVTLGLWLWCRRRVRRLPEPEPAPMPQPGPVQEEGASAPVPVPVSAPLVFRTAMPDTYLSNAELLARRAQRKATATTRMQQRHRQPVVAASASF